MFSKVQKLRNSQLPDSHRSVLTCRRVDFPKSGNPVSDMHHQQNVKASSSHLNRHSLGYINDTQSRFSNKRACLKLVFKKKAQCITIIQPHITVSFKRVISKDTPFATAFRNYFSSIRLISSIIQKTGDTLNLEGKLSGSSNVASLIRSSKLFLGRSTNKYSPRNSNERIKKSF